MALTPVRGALKAPLTVHTLSPGDSKWGTVMTNNDKIDELVTRTRKITMSSGQLREQRRSFAFGNTNIENDRITREMVAEADRKIEAESK